MKILFLSQRVPYPPNRGDKITTWRLAERMAREHEVRIAAFAHDEADEKAARDLEEMGFQVAIAKPRSKLAALPALLTKTPITRVVFGSRELQRKVDAWIDDMDLAYAYSSSMGAFFLPHDLPRVMHFAELDSDKWTQYSKLKPFPMNWVYGREARTLLEFEKELAAKAAECVFCTPLEQEVFERLIPGVDSLVMLNGVNLEKYQPAPERAEPGHMVFVGVMNYYPNVEGCEWFCEEILPRIQERVEGAHLSIVGAHPTPAIEALGNKPGVHVTGFVDDTVEWLERASVSIAPLRVARGIQNKVLEALAMGLPIVGTSSATQGVGGVPGRDYLVEDTVEGQVEAICGLLRDSDRAKELGKRGRTFAEEHHDWEVCLRPLDAILAKYAPQS